MNNRRNVMKIWALALLAGAGSVAAFPTWMGVYGSYARHDGRNPGQFTILMNEDYFGLEANVGVRVNGGAWQEFAMSWQTNASGNSVWAYTPPEPFPFGAVIEYYFHGYEAASNIYDSADTRNYHGGPLHWSAPRETGLVSAYPGNGYGRVRMTTLGQDLVGGHAYSVLTLDRKPAGQDWEPLDYPLADTSVYDFGVAGSGQVLVVACQLDTNLAVRRSTDRGESFSDSQWLASQPENGTFAGLSVAAGAAGEFGIAYGIATNCCGAQQVWFTRTTDNGATWSAPAVVMESGDYAYFSWIELGHNDNGWYLAGRNVWQGSSILMYCARSTNGTAWTTDNLGGNRAWSEADLSLTTNTACIAADPYYDSYIRVWRHQGSGWSTQSISRVLESGRNVRLGNDGRTNWYLYRQVDNNAGTLWSWFWSADNGGTWTTNRALYNPPAQTPGSDNFTLEQVANAGPKQYLLWHADYYVGMYQRMHTALLQASDGYDEVLDDLLWNGREVTAVLTNIAPGATNHLEMTDDIVNPNWTNRYTWRGLSDETNWTGTVGTQGWFRVRVER